MNENSNLRWTSERNGEGETNGQSDGKREQGKRGKRNSSTEKKKKKSPNTLNALVLTRCQDPLLCIYHQSIPQAHILSLIPWSSGNTQADVTMGRSKYTAMAGTSVCNETTIRLLPAWTGSIQDQTWIWYIHIHLHILGNHKPPEVLPMAMGARLRQPIRY